MSKLMVLDAHRTGQKSELREKPPECFPGWIWVVIKSDRLCRMEHLKVGDWVLSRDEITGEQAYRRVVNKFQHLRDRDVDPHYLITFATPEGLFYGEDCIEATAEHPFWVNGLGWVKAGDLRAGQMLEICDPIGDDNGNRQKGQKREDFIFTGRRWQAEILSVEQCKPSRIVYNIEVEDFHTYFVGCHGVWVHNKIKPI